MSTVQFNLLPDVKETYINAQKNRRAVKTIATLATVVSIAIFILMFVSVNVIQKKLLSVADNNVQNASKQLQSINGISKIVTVQNQLTQLSSLQQSKHAAARIFQFMPQLTPTAATISSLSIDFTNGGMQVTGTADSQTTVNTFVDTLKYATYKIASTDPDKPAFTNVVLSSFTIDPGKASYTITATADPNLFTNPLSNAPTITVKNQVTTRSVLDDPSQLFKAQTNKTGAQ